MAVRIPIKTEGGQQAVNDLNKVGSAGQTALDRINRASKEPNVGLKALSGASNSVREALEGMGQSTGAVGRVLSTLGPVGIAAGAALGLVTIGLANVTREADIAERSRLKIEALLRTTQNASGQTYQSINQLADQIALSTLATGDAVEAASAVLLTFKSVAGDAFGRTLKVGQDMAAVMGSDIKSAVVQLGKALEDPERNLSALNRSGISFTETQIDLIKYLVQSGDKTRALSEILNILEGQIGGAGQAEAGTLSGAFHGLTERVGMFLEKIGNTGPLEAFTEIVRKMGEGMGVIDAAIFKDLDTQIAAKFEDLVEAQAQADANAASGRNSRLGRNSNKALEERIALLREELQALTDKRQAEAAAAAQAQQSAQTAKIAASEEAIATKMREDAEKRMDEVQKDREKRTANELADRKRIAAAQATATKSIDDQIAGLENEQTALALAERERAVFVELLKAEEAARKGGIAVTNEQREAIIKETEALFDQRKAIDDRKEAEADAKRDAEKAAKERERIAEKEAEAMQRPFIRAGKGIQNALTDSIENGLNGSLDTAEAVFDQIKRIAIRAAAEIASAMVINATIGNITYGGGGGGGLISAGAQLANPGGGGGGIPSIPGTSSLAQMGGGYGGAFLGAGAGALYGYQQGGTRGAVIGGVAGYAGGAALTAGAGALAAGWGGAASGGAALAGASSALAAIPVWGWAALAALAIFGSGKKAPSNKSAWGAIDLASGDTSQFGNQQGKKFSQETVDARDAFFEAIGALSGALQSATGGTLVGSVRADIGQRDGTQVSGLGAGRYATPDAALQAIFRGMMNGLQGIDAQFKNVFGKLDLTDMEKAVQELGLAASIIKKEYVETEPLNAAAQAIKNVTEAFKPLIEGANRLGLAVAPINTELNRQLAKLTTDFNGSISDMILSITDPQALALKVEQAAAKERLDNARELGANITEVERLNALRRQQIVEQSADASLQSLKAANQSIEQFLTGLRSGSGSLLSPQAVLANAESDFQRLSGLAQGGDVEARGSLANAAQNLVAATQAVWGSSEMTFQRIGFIESTLNNLIGSSGSTTTFDNLGATIVQGNAMTEYQLKQLNDRMEFLTQEMQNIASLLERSAAA